MKILGITVSSNLSFTIHIANVVNKCNKIFYMLRIMKLYNMPQESCIDIFNSLIISQITYGISTWYGFSKEHDNKRIRKIIRRGLKLGYLKTELDLDAIVESRSKSLFKKIMKNSWYVLHKLLPPVKETTYDLRQIGHGLTLPSLNTPYDTRNFILHMLYKMTI